MDTSGWFAYVKYKDNEKEKVPISKISDVIDKGKKIPFQPKNLNDYVYGKLYSVRTSLRSKDGKESKYYAVIGKLAESLEALNNMRPRWPDLQIDDEEPESTGVEDQEENKPVNYFIQKNKDQDKITKNRKRDAANKEFALFIENNVLNEKIPDQNVSIELAKKKKKKTKHDADNVQTESGKNRDSIETKSLLEKIQQLQAELKKKDEALSFASNQQVKHLEKIFVKKMKELEERLEKNLEEKVKVVEDVVGECVNQLHQKISNIENMMKMHVPSFTPTSSSVASESEEKVHLGEGIMCSKYAHQVLSTVKEHSDWAVALLTGVYGDEARKMRYGKPRSPDLQSFSHSFVNVAKYHYRKWLESFTMGNTEDRKYSSAQVEDLINSLPGYLSKRCIDMNGPRLKKSDTSNERLQQRKPDPNRKRPYQRRGSLLQLQPLTTTQQLQIDHQEPPVLQQLQNQQQHLEQLNTPVLPETGYPSWQTFYNVYDEPQGPAAVPIIPNSSVPKNCEIGHNTLRL